MIATVRHGVLAISEWGERKMADVSGNGARAADGVATAVIVKFVFPLMVAAGLGMASIIWANLTSQISNLMTQINEVRSDNRVLQKDIYDSRLSIQKLETRLISLVETLNSREEQRFTGKR